jgi:hypothetical protein
MGVPVDKLVHLYDKKPIFVSTTDKRVAFNISCFDIEEPVWTLKYSLDCIKSTERDDVRSVAGLYVFFPNGVNYRLTYAELADAAEYSEAILRTTPDTPNIYNIDHKVLAELKSTKPEYISFDYDKLFPIFSNVCATYKWGSKYRCVIIGCGLISAPSGSVMADKLKSKAVASLSETVSRGLNPYAMIDDSDTKPIYIPYASAEELKRELISIGSKKHMLLNAAGGARKTLKRNRNRNRTARSTKSSKKLANRRHIVRHRRRPYSRTKS